MRHMQEKNHSQQSGRLVVLSDLQKENIKMKYMVDANTRELVYLSDLQKENINMKYVVLQRFGENYITFIMILDDKGKAEGLAKFLNDGKYFESEVTVEAVDKRIPNGRIMDLLARII